MSLNPRSLDVVVVGNVGIDTNVYPTGGEFDPQVESNFTENLDCIGQAGGYASLGYARLGKATAFIGTVGDDYQGRFIRDTFARERIHTAGLFVDPAGTSRSVNLMQRDGRRRNFYDGKSHLTLRPDLDLCRSILSRARLAHFNIPDWARHLLSIARDLGLTIACDIQDVVDPDDAYRRDFVEQADILFFSATNRADPTDWMQGFMRRRPGQIVIAGMGGQGCAMGAAGEVRFFSPVDMDAPVVDTNGAGDSLAVGFLASYVLDGYSLEDAVLRGQIAARHACTLRGSSDGLITAEQMEVEFQARRG